MRDRIWDMLPEIFDVLFKTQAVIYYIPLYRLDPKIYKVNQKQLGLSEGAYFEYACLPHDCSWIYHHCHEGPIAFAGDILGEIMEITNPARQYWDIYAGG